MFLGLLLLALAYAWRLTAARSPDPKFRMIARLLEPIGEPDVDSERRRVA